MLPVAARLTRREDFSSVLRRGRRAGRTLVVVYVLVPDAIEDVGATDRTANRPVPAGSARVGLVVSKAVGGSVVRHRVSRRLRHLMRERLAGLPPGTDLVLRALPRAAAAESAALGAEVDRALRILLPGVLLPAGSTPSGAS